MNSQRVVAFLQHAAVSRCCGASMGFFPPLRCGRNNASGSAAVGMRGRIMRMRLQTARFLLAASLLALSPMAVRAETLESALAKAYLNNPELNAERAGVRVADENVRCRAPASARCCRCRSTRASAITRSSAIRPAPAAGQCGISLQQNIFDGFRTQNRVRSGGFAGSCPT